MEARISADSFIVVIVQIVR